MKTKLCPECDSELSLADFNKNSRKKDGLQSICRKCQKARNTQWQKDNRDNVKIRGERYRDKNRDRYLANRRRNRTGDPNLKVFPYDENLDLKKCVCCLKDKRGEEFLLDKRTNRPGGKCVTCRQDDWKNKKQDPEFCERERARLSKLQRKKRSTPQGNINARLSNAVWYALKQNKSFRHWGSLVGYEACELKEHLEKQFTEGMTWELFLAGEIHIDHKIPKCYFKYTSPEDDDFKKCWALENLQPLWRLDNLRKSGKIPAHL